MDGAERSRRACRRPSLEYELHKRFAEEQTIYGRRVFLKVLKRVLEELGPQPLEEGSSPDPKLRV